MTALFLIILLAASMFLCLHLLGGSFSSLRRSYYLGITLWASWSPLIALAVYVLVLGANLNKANLNVFPFADLGGFLSKPECIVLFLLTPLMLTRAANIAGAAVAIYSIERLVLTPSLPASNMGILTLIGCATVIMILGDKLPWLQGRERGSVTAKKMRELLILTLCFGSIAVIFGSIMNIQGFSHWLATTFGWSLSTNTSLAFLLLLFLGWVSVALGVTRHFTLPLLSLPSLFTLAFVTQWPSYILVIPFAAGLALSLAIADRRLYTRPV